MTCKHWWGKTSHDDLIPLGLSPSCNQRFSRILRFDLEAVMR
jgi:hypothetical protein